MKFLLTALCDADVVCGGLLRALRPPQRFGRCPELSFTRLGCLLPLEGGHYYRSREVTTAAR